MGHSRKYRMSEKEVTSRFSRLTSDARVSMFAGMSAGAANATPPSDWMMLATPGIEDLGLAAKYSLGLDDVTNK
ncbi:hypothetical protein I553_2469 [Mycobacterium xenopi 4042]|uniref:Uncharacterized protein n=1 Tax=Mycobacterium xenopi 4042 TaxID=1299334 RepID=X8CA34_MYCXE|nr:hypothetical protein I553_2469 [Mycobacterium xenopi 4042]